MHAKAKSRCAYELFGGAQGEVCGSCQYPTKAVGARSAGRDGKVCPSVKWDMAEGKKCRIGKRIRVDLEAANKAECRQIMDEISRRVLVNPNMETYEYEIREESGE